MGDNVVFLFFAQIVELFIGISETVYSTKRISNFLNLPFLPMEAIKIVNANYVAFCYAMLIGNGSLQFMRHLPFRVDDKWLALTDVSSLISYNLLKEKVDIRTKDKHEVDFEVGIIFYKLWIHNNSLRGKKLYSTLYISIYMCCRSEHILCILIISV